MHRLRFNPAARRRGVILIVVLFFLTLFAALGLSFLYYAQAEANSARLFREAEAPERADVSSEALLEFFLGQLIYDVDDHGAGLDSALRGHSLARLLYGWDADNPASNVIPFNGTGRLHEPIVFQVKGRPVVMDGQQLVNYTAFRNGNGSLADGFVRDPERLGQRTGLGQPPGPYTGGFNAPYTYPDLNNLFLAALRADGTLLAPSYHRSWTGFGPLDPANPNWTDRRKPWLRYQVLRPRPADMGPGFPLPAEPGGDVKNLPDIPGGNDSFWIDLGFPVLTAKDGRKFKPLFAPLILDLDGRINLNVHGNARGAGSTHRSNQGWGPWEVNPGYVLPRGNEWTNLLVGTQRPLLAGRYGPDRTPGLAGQQAPPIPRPHSYAQMDSDAANEGPGGLPTGRVLLPGDGAPPLSAFPTFPPGYGNASGGGRRTERFGHPLLNNSLRPAGDDRTFSLADLAALLRDGGTGGRVGGNLGELSPVNLASSRSRRLVTTHSFDLDRPGVFPWLFDRDDSG